MSVILGIVHNPLDPRTWQEYEVDDIRAALVDHFGTWPSTARIFDLDGFGDWRRCASVITPEILAHRDITPPGVPGPDHDAAVERLGRVRGPILVSVAPADPLTAILTVAAVAIGLAAAFLFMPKLNVATQRLQSANNSLTSRTNQPRVGQRIEDIFGTVEATPTLLAVPFTQFINNVESEEAYMCIGRGAYQVSRVRDGTTNVASISGASVAVYGPDTSPNSGDAPQLQIGPAINSPVRTVLRLNEVNGQTLQPTNLNRVQGEDSIRFVYPDTIQSNDSSINFTDYFQASDAIDVAQAAISGESGLVQTVAVARFLDGGEVEFQDIDPSVVFAGATNITIVNGTYAGDNGAGGVVYVDLTGTYPIDSMSSTKIVLDDPEAVVSDWELLNQYPNDRTEYRSITFTRPVATSGINLNGSYVALSVTANAIVLSNPELVNAAWINLQDLPGGATDYISPSISRNTQSWIGPFVMELSDTNRILCNFVALNGLYTLSKKKGKQRSLSVGIQIEVTPVNSSGNPIGPAQAFNISMVGSDTERTTIGVSLWATPSSPGRFSIRARRTTATPDDDDYGAVVDEVKWRDSFAMAPVSQTHFGDVTTVHSRTVATPGALAVKERKLNMRVTRLVPERIAGSIFGDLIPSDNVDDIISAICLDPLIGRRDLHEVDFDSIYDTVAEVKSYFRSESAGKFGYTFDDPDISAEETLATVAQAAFSSCFRQGSTIRMKFERANNQSVLLFNARNILPGSQSRIARFGPLDDHDGVELDYTDPEDGMVVTFNIPADQSARNPLNLEIPGVRHYEQAYWHAWRARNKSLFQNVSTNFEATQEAALVVTHDRILVANRTRPGVLQGDVEAQDGVNITLSEEAVLDPDKEWLIFIQHIDATVEVLGVSSWVPGPGEEPDPFRVVLSAAPRLPLYVDADAYAKATYIIVPFDDVEAKAFLVSEQEPNSNFTASVSAVNYTFLYYQHDQLEFWLNPKEGYVDSGPFDYVVTPLANTGIVNDPDRGLVHYGSSASSGGVRIASIVSPESYTKAFWFNRSASAPNGAVLSSFSGSLESVFFSVSTSRIRVGHSGSTKALVNMPAPEEWHHLAVTYDAPTGELAIYMDGKLESRASDVAQRTLGAVAVSGYNNSANTYGFVGGLDDVRLYSRALDADEIIEIYLGSLMPGS